MPSRKIESQLEALASLRRSGLSGDAVAILQKSLADPVALVAAKAAEVASELRAEVLMAALLKAYARLFEGGPKADPQCWGKIAIAKALKDLDHNESAPFLRGIVYQQWEPV